MKNLVAVPVEHSAIKKIAIRLVPFIVLMFFINYLDRTAISFVGPNEMDHALGLTAAQFGFASGVFFIGYILLEELHYRSSQRLDRQLQRSDVPGRWFHAALRDLYGRHQCRRPGKPASVG